MARGNCAIKLADLVHVSPANDIKYGKRWVLNSLLVLKLTAHRIHVLPFADSVEGLSHLFCLQRDLTAQGSPETFLMCTCDPTSLRPIDLSEREMSFKFGVA